MNCSNVCTIFSYTSWCYCGTYHRTEASPLQHHIPCESELSWRWRTATTRDLSLYWSVSSLRRLPNSSSLGTHEPNLNLALIILLTAACTTSSGSYSRHAFSLTTGAPTCSYFNLYLSCSLCSRHCFGISVITFCTPHGPCSSHYVIFFKSSSLNSAPTPLLLQAKSQVWSPHHPESSCGPRPRSPLPPRGSCSCKKSREASSHAACFSALHKKLISITTTRMKQRAGILWQ